MKPTPTEFELAWQAYRYISAEMTPSELDAFEARLDGDQQAREAVARVAEIQLAVQAMPTAGLQLAPRSARWAAPAAWMSLGVAVSVLVMISASWLNAIGGDRQRPGGSQQDTEVARAWVPAGKESASVDVPAGESAADAEELETPSWITAAITYEDKLEKVMPIESEVN